MESNSVLCQARGKNTLGVKPAVRPNRQIVTVARNHLEELSTKTGETCPRILHNSAVDSSSVMCQSCGENTLGVNCTGVARCHDNVTDDNSACDFETSSPSTMEESPQSAPLCDQLCYQSQAVKECQECQNRARACGFGNVSGGSPICFQQQNHGIHHKQCACERGAVQPLQSCSLAKGDTGGADGGLDTGQEGDGTLKLAFREFCASTSLHGWQHLNMVSLIKI